jgi:6-phosphogluconolactonase
MAIPGKSQPKVIAGRHHFANRQELAEGLAQAVGAALSRTVSNKGHATLAVSGGTTPALFFDCLSRSAITWEKVTVTLVDERQVTEDSPRSNARLARQALLQNKAAKAKFVPLFQNTAAAAKLNLDVVVLGMGEDGHTASFFPGGDTLAKAIDPNGSCALFTINAPGAGEPRLTYALPKLVAAERLFLHIEGGKKRQILEQALAGQDALAMPIRAVLQSPANLRLYWCP